jgi:hypothetical protein
MIMEQLQVAAFRSLSARRNHRTALWPHAGVWLPSLSRQVASSQPSFLLKSWICCSRAAPLPGEIPGRCTGGTGATAAFHRIAAET